MPRSVLILWLAVLWAIGAAGYRGYSYGTGDAVHLIDQYKGYSSGTHDPYIPDDYGNGYDSYGDGYVLEDYGSDDNVAYVLVDDRDPYGQYGAVSYAPYDQYGTYYSEYEPYGDDNAYTTEDGYPLAAYHPEETYGSYEKYDRYGADMYGGYDKPTPRVKYDTYDKYKGYDEYLPSGKYDDYEDYNYDKYGAHGDKSDKLYDNAYYGYGGHEGYGDKYDSYDADHDDYDYKPHPHYEYEDGKYEPLNWDDYTYAEPYGAYGTVGKAEKYDSDGGYTTYEKEFEVQKYGDNAKYGGYNDYIYAKYKSPIVDDSKAYRHKYYSMGQGYKRFKPRVSGKHYDTYDGKYDGLITYGPVHTKKHESVYDHYDYQPQKYDDQYDIKPTDGYDYKPYYESVNEKSAEHYGEHDGHGEGKFYGAYDHYGKHDKYGHDSLHGEYGTDGHLHVNDKLLHDDRYKMYGGIRGNGKMSGFQESEKGLKYEEVTSFHQGGSVDTYGKHKKRYGGYDTQGKIKQYGDEFLRRKHAIQGELKARGKTGRYSDEDAKAKFSLHTRIRDYGKENQYGNRKIYGNKRGGEETEFYGEWKGHGGFGSYDREKGHRDLDDYGTY
ncbi:unnamed protein product [Dicrocoelium dendriticum]|nr:unnamed protein product [Dicrocoelium dendriticum]